MKHLLIDALNAQERETWAHSQKLLYFKAAYIVLALAQLLWLDARVIAALILFGSALMLSAGVWMILAGLLQYWLAISAVIYATAWAFGTITERTVLMIFYTLSVSIAFAFTFSTLSISTLRKIGWRFPALIYMFATVRHVLSELELMLQSKEARGWHFRPYSLRSQTIVFIDAVKLIFIRSQTLEESLAARGVE